MHQKKTTDRLPKKMKLFTKALSTSCCALVHIPKAAKMARRESFAMLKYYGLNGLFLAVSAVFEFVFTQSLKSL